MKLTLLEKKHEVNDIYTFKFAKPKNFNYFAGQYCYVTLENVKDDPRGNLRQFTLSSSPTEDVISFTTHIGPSTFKQTLHRMLPGGKADFDGPHGVLHSNELVKEHNVFIAEWLGITPFRSIAKFIADTRQNIPLEMILMGNVGLFEVELQNFSNLKLNQIHSEKLYEKLKELKATYPNADYWVVGPRKMVTTTENILYKLKVQPENVKTEKFTGL